ncbi:hypothetical protein ANN_13723 [Periplaneta americana]|uniref:Uncharacterized protein n=1 Tax=Periplaneta americana TaxID=6978 RepID=A0ABQ8SUB8_PERAM|nr:hypothetical protein ANN_13723 [Periplaneta americana]
MFVRDRAYLLVFRTEPIREELCEPPAWLSRLRRLPADLKLHSGTGSIPTWADYLVGFFPNRNVNVRGRRHVKKLNVRETSVSGLGEKSELCERWLRPAETIPDQSATH